jgi:hypothetical protein
MAEVLGWQCVVPKAVKAGDLVVYIEIDSKLPRIPLFEFMESRRYKVRTARFLGQISQGLALPLDDAMLRALGRDGWKEGDDVTDVLQIVKYEPELNAPENEPPLNDRRWGITRLFMRMAWFRAIYFFLFGEPVRGTFPSFIVKTNENRIQNYPSIFEREEPLTNLIVTEKLNGTSATYFVVPRGGIFGPKWEFGACSHNWRVSPYGKTEWAEVARKYKLEQVLTRLAERHYPKGIAIQGEIIGPKIQGNQYASTELEFFVFNLIDIGKGGVRSPFGLLISDCAAMGLPTVPILDLHFSLEGQDMASVLKMAEGETVLPMKKPCQREGLVIRSTDQKFSCKVLSNVFLEATAKKEIEAESQPAAE